MCRWVRHLPLGHLSFKMSGGPTCSGIIVLLFSCRLQRIVCVPGILRMGKNVGSSYKGCPTHFEQCSLWLSLALLRFSWAALGLSWGYLQTLLDYLGLNGTLLALSWDLFHPLRLSWALLCMH